MSTIKIEQWNTVTCKEVNTKCIDIIGLGWRLFQPVGGMKLTALFDMCVTSAGGAAFTVTISLLAWITFDIHGC